MNDLYQGVSHLGGPVECLGRTFSSDGERREYFLAQLAERLKDPAFRKTEGFLQGIDDARCLNVDGIGFGVGDWCWFTRQISPCRVIEGQGKLPTNVGLITA